MYVEVPKATYIGDFVFRQISFQKHFIYSNHNHQCLDKTNLTDKNTYLSSKMAH